MTSKAVFSSTPSVSRRPTIDGGRLAELMDHGRVGASVAPVSQGAQAPAQNRKPYGPPLPSLSQRVIDGTRKLLDRFGLGALLDARLSVNVHTYESKNFTITNNLAQRLSREIGLSWTVPKNEICTVFGNLALKASGIAPLGGATAYAPAAEEDAMKRARLVPLSQVRAGDIAFGTQHMMLVARMKDGKLALLGFNATPQGYGHVSVQLISNQESVADVRFYRLNR